MRTRHLKILGARRQTCRQANRRATASLRGPSGWATQAARSRPGTWLWACGLPQPAPSCRSWLSRQPRPSIMAGPLAALCGPGLVPSISKSFASPELAVPRPMGAPGPDPTSGELQLLDRARQGEGIHSIHSGARDATGLRLLGRTQAGQNGWSPAGLPLHLAKWRAIPCSGSCSIATSGTTVPTPRPSRGRKPQAPSPPPTAQMFLSGTTVHMFHTPSSSSASLSFVLVPGIPSSRSLPHVSGVHLEFAPCLRPGSPTRYTLLATPTHDHYTPRPHWEGNAR